MSTPRGGRRYQATATHKRRKMRAGEQIACEVCGWMLPQHLAGGSGEVSAVHAHHVIPVQCGGGDEEENLVLLCPNHHCIAHRIGHVMTSDGRRVYVGPTTRAALLDQLRLADDPAAVEESARSVFRVDLMAREPQPGG